MFRRLRQRIGIRVRALWARLVARLYAPLRAWFIRAVYLPYLYRAHLRYWPATDAIRRLLRRKPLPVPCCRRADLRGGTFAIKGADPGLTGSRCLTCKRRHLVLIVDPASLEIVIKG